AARCLTDGCGTTSPSSDKTLLCASGWRCSWGDTQSRGRPMQFHWRRFDELDRDQLYAILALSPSVLALDQPPPYPDLDFVDQVADHLIATDNDTLIGYARCHAPLPGLTHASFGRLVVAQAYRKTGLGKEFVRRLLAHLAEGSAREIAIGAQLHLE